MSSVKELESRIAELEADIEEREAAERRREQRAFERQTRPEWPKRVGGLWRDAAGNVVPAPGQDVEEAAAVRASANSKASNEHALGQLFDEVTRGAWPEGSRTRQSEREAFIASNGDMKSLSRFTDASGRVRRRDGTIHSADERAVERRRSGGIDWDEETGDPIPTTGGDYDPDM